MVCVTGHAVAPAVLWIALTENAVLSEAIVTRGDPVPVTPLPIRGVTPLISATFTLLPTTPGVASAIITFSASPTAPISVLNGAPVSPTLWLVRVSPKYHASIEPDPVKPVTTTRQPLTVPYQMIVSFRSAEVPTCE